MARPSNLLLVLMLAIIGSCAGCIGGAFLPIRHSENFPLPHHIPKYPGGVSLRFAMVHDVIHERFRRHGSAYYEERNRRVSAALKEEEAKAGQPTPRYWDLLDDLGVGLDLLGRHEEAVALMRDKLKRQQDAGITGRALYGSYANLGTFLILWQIQEGFADKEKAKQRIRESIDLIHKAIEVKPDAHFGREVWQAVLEEFILAVLDQPELLLKYDMVGDRLDYEIDPSNLRAFDRATPGAVRGNWRVKQYLRESSARQASDVAEEQIKQTQDPRNGITEQRVKERQELRNAITKVGADDGWEKAVNSPHTTPVPFDEPTLGIIGMWRYGGGANPHFALALGEIMLRVGQRYIAWTAYERAFQLSGALGPGPIAQKFGEHCRKRQQVIESQLPENEVARLRPRFEQELAFGQAYQKACQEYEMKHIREGASIDDPHFYDAFDTEHGSIASPVGEEDRFVVVRSSFPSIAHPLTLLGAGVFAFVTALWLRYRARSR
jgi:tetratricopeptide (TPR) repeat protein